MSNKIAVENKALYGKVRVLANAYRFRILELVGSEELSITQLSRRLKLSYTKCADYVAMLEKEGLVKKTRKGREVIVQIVRQFAVNTLKL